MGKYEAKITESTDTEINLQDFLIPEAANTESETSKV